MAESVFGINTDNTDELGRKIGMEGNNFEELINTIQQKIDECGNYWTGATYESFRDQTASAAKKLTILKNFFAKYGQDVYKFSSDSKDAMNTINTTIRGRI